MKKRIATAFVVAFFLLGFYRLAPRIKKMANAIKEFIYSLKINAIRENQSC
jgi:hypothetical protein